MTDNIINAVLVSICSRTSELDECERSLDELERLLDTAGGVCIAKVIQVKESFEPRTCIGSGKVEEIRELCRAEGAELVVFDFELTPAQIRNLENDFDGPSVIDRSMLILDIFAKHAVSGDGKLQVELAQLKYSAPRLIGKGAELSRQGGGIGSRGPGETKLETDRRHLKERIDSLERKLYEMEQNRAIMRSSRDKSGIAKLAVVGYTNSGKSTLLNTLTDAGVLSENKLFATLDPTTRKMVLPSGESVLITDTVGFIRKLPHHLIKAFKSTLDEVRYADVLLVVADATDSELPEHLRVTHEIVEQLDAADKPVIYAYNKCDALDAKPRAEGEDTVFISALTGEGVDGLIRTVENVISRKKKKAVLIIPYAEQSAISAIYDSYSVESVDYSDSGIYVTAVLDSKGIGLYKKYIKES